MNFIYVIPGVRYCILEGYSRFDALNSAEEFSKLNGHEFNANNFFEMELANVTHLIQHKTTTLLTKEQRAIAWLKSETIDCASAYLSKKNYNILKITHANLFEMLQHFPKLYFLRYRGFGAKGLNELLDFMTNVLKIGVPQHYLLDEHPLRNSELVIDENNVLEFFTDTTRFD